MYGWEGRIRKIAQGLRNSRGRKENKADCRNTHTHTHTQHTNLTLRHQILEKRRVPARRQRREAHAQDPVRGRAVEPRRLRDGYQPLVRRRQSRHPDAVPVYVALDVTRTVLHGRRHMLRGPALVVPCGQRAALGARAEGTGDDEVRTARVELHGEGLGRGAGADG